MTRLYITKWVLARGILTMEGEVEDAPTPRGYIKRVWVSLPGLRYPRVLLLGREVFESLKEAREDARHRFEMALRQARAAAGYLEKASARLDELKVHKKGVVVSKCRAFEDLHSGALSFVGPPEPLRFSRGTRR